MLQVQNTITDWRKLSRKDLRRGVSGDFVMTLLSLAIITYFIWGFDYIYRLYDRVVIYLLPVAFSTMVFFEGMRQERKGLRLSWWSVGVVFLLALVLALALSDKFGLYSLRLNIAMVMLSYPWLVIFGILVREKRILAIGMVPTAIILMAYWVMPTPYSELNLNDFLLLLLAVSFVIAAWTVLVWILFKGLDRWSKHCTLAPLMESLAMLSLFTPFMVLAIWVPKNDLWWRRLVCGCCCNSWRYIWRRNLGANERFSEEIWKSPLASQSFWKQRSCARSGYQRVWELSDLGSTAHAYLNFLFNLLYGFSHRR